MIVVGVSVVKMASWNVNLGAGGLGRPAKVATVKKLAAEGVDLLALQEVWPGALAGLTGEDGFAHAFIRPSSSVKFPKASAILVSGRVRRRDVLGGLIHEYKTAA